jgi:methionine synthase I (cobalamin-dependent)/5,10-methylenetetrahydrofolate reductase
MPYELSRRLAAGPLLCDGAMGTLLYACGVSADACFDVLNLNNPRVIQSIHADYIAAGADCIETNTFGANRFKLAAHGLDGQVRDINRRGAALARDVRESAGRDVFVLGSVGPLGKYLAPLGTVTADEARTAFQEQAEALLEGGVDAFIIETFSDLEELALAVGAIRGITTDVPIIAQIAFTDDGATFTGRPAAEIARAIRALPIQALGANCSVGSSTLYEVLVQMHAEATNLPLCIQPNAGLPSRIGERLIYLSSPSYMADYAGRMVDAGARLIGGCCGTTPQHIAAMRVVLDRRRPARPETRRPTLTVTPVAEAEPGLRVARPPTVLGRKLAAREFLVTVELDPPRGHTVEKLVQGAKLLRERGVDIVDINDGSLGRVRMAVLPTALLVRDATGLDITMHFTCRDRNLMGIQGDLLGAHALDVRNILAMTGDPPRAGDYANATAVFDVDGVGLIEILRRMNEGQDATGSSIGEPTSFYVGAALNPAAEDVDREIDRFHKKVQAGARWVQTQPVYDLAELDRFLDRAGGSPVPVLVGILPLHSARHAEFLHNEVPGITIPEPIRRRLREAGDGALRAGIEMAQELVRAVRARYAGAYLMPSFGRFEVVAEVLDAIR